MKTVTQTMLYRQALIKYSLKYGVTKAAIRGAHGDGSIVLKNYEKLTGDHWSPLRCRLKFIM